MNYEEDSLYQDAMKKIDELIEDVFTHCEEVAEQNDYSKAWVLDIFREKFNRNRRNYNE